MSKRNFIECFPNEEGSFNIPNSNLWIKEIEESEAIKVLKELVATKELIIQELKKAMILGKDLYDNINWDDLEHYEVKTKDEHIQSLEKALKELVELKKLKDYLDDVEILHLPEDWEAKHKDYLIRKPLAWEAARKLISSDK